MSVNIASYTNSTRQIKYDHLIVAYSRRPVYSRRRGSGLPVDALAVTVRKRRAGCGNQRWKYSCRRGASWSSDTRKMRRDLPPSPSARSRVWKREEFVARRNAMNKRVALIGMHRARRMDTLRGDTVLNLSVRDRWNLSGGARVIVAGFALWGSSNRLRARFPCSF